jgi:hypothetical protein
MEAIEQIRTIRWGKTYGWWLHHPMMDADRFCILAALSTYADEDGTCHPSQATLARHLKRSRPWVNRVIGELTEYGLIEKTARTRSSNAGTTSCEYRLVVQPGLGFEEETPVTPMTSPCHGGDAPCHGGDTTQLEAKHNQNTRPDARDLPDQPVHREESNLQQIEPVPQGWRPSAEAMVTAKGLCPAVDLDAHAVMFAAKCRSKGYRYLPDGIDDAWLAWLVEDRLRDDDRKAQPRNHAPPGAHVGTVRLTPHEIAQQRLAAWAASATAPPIQTANPWR